jgi:hypothetical protein
LTCSCRGGRHHAPSRSWQGSWRLAAQQSIACREETLSGRQGVRTYRVFRAAARAEEDAAQTRCHGARRARTGALQDRADAQARTHAGLPRARSCRSGSRSVHRRFRMDRPTAKAKAASRQFPDAAPA